MIALVWIALAYAAPAVVPIDPAAPPVEGKLTAKDAKDAKGLPFDAFTVDAPAGTWVEATVRGAEIPLRVRVGDQSTTFEAFQADGAVARGWSTGGPVSVEIGARNEALLGAYTLSIAFVRPSTSEPPTVDKLPPYMAVEATDWVVDGWFCELVSARYAEATPVNVGSTAEDGARLRLLAGRWVDGALVVDAWGEAAPSRSGPVDIALEAGVPRVFGACRDRLGTSYLEVRTPEAYVAPGVVFDPNRKPATRDEAAALVKADLERRYEVVSVEEGQANRYDAFVVPMFLQSGFGYEIVALTENDSLAASAKLYFGYCDAMCEGFVASSGNALPKDGTYTVVELVAVDEPQPYAPTRTARWRFRWPEGTSITMFLRIHVGSIGAEGVTVVIGEE